MAKNTEYLRKYQKQNIRVYKMKVNKNTENELNDWLRQKENVQGYLKHLVREDMKREAEGQGEEPG